MMEKWIESSHEEVVKSVAASFVPSLAALSLWPVERLV